MWELPGGLVVEDLVVSQLWLISDRWPWNFRIVPWFPGGGVGVGDDKKKNPCVIILCQDRDGYKIIFTSSGSRRIWIEQKC